MTFFPELLFFYGHTALAKDYKLTEQPVKITKHVFTLCQSQNNISDMLELLSSSKCAETQRQDYYMYYELPYIVSSSIQCLCTSSTCM